MFVVHRAGQKVARHAAGHADRVEAAAALAAGLFDRGETVVGADIRGRQTPVAGCDRQAGAVEQLQRGGIGRAVDASSLRFRAFIDSRPGRAKPWIKFRVQRQYRR
jgi:hypothetical protein